MSYRILRWWYGRVLARCSICKKPACQDYPNPREQPYLARWRR